MAATLRFSNQAPELVYVPTYHNHKPATNHSSISLPSSYSFCKSTPRLYSSSRVYNRGILRASSETMATEKLGIKIVKNPPESKLTDLGVRSWPKWGCPPSKFPWTYSSKETCYLLKGKVKVYPEGSDEGVEIGVGDLVEFPKGMNCTWDVSETVDKHYDFE
uniref:(S)-ureidoglycine aminohydrolase cupin domain-containing protein n=1 Tax=Cynara cardunculus var. scolymus TaxID=59895 RepID=A0A103JSJ6_CYNCS